MSHDAMVSPVPSLNSKLESRALGTNWVVLLYTNDLIVNVLFLRNLESFYVSHRVELSMASQK